jgi:hypothetical protein
MSNNNPDADGTRAYNIFNSEPAGIMKTAEY